MESGTVSLNYMITTLLKSMITLLPSASALLIGKTTNQIKPNQVRSNQLLVFEEREKPEYPRKNLSEQGLNPGIEPGTQST